MIGGNKRWSDSRFLISTARWSTSISRAPVAALV